MQYILSQKLKPMDSSKEALIPIQIFLINRYLKFQDIVDT